MLNKLLKYEIKSTSRIILPFYLILLALSVVGRFSIGSMMNDSFPENSLASIFFGLVITAYVFLVFSAFIVTLVVIIQRFYKNITGREGYLMHTLPVTTHQLLISKMVTSFIWMISTGIMVSLSLGILLVQAPTWVNMSFFLETLQGALGDILHEVGGRAVLTIILFVVSIIVSTFSAILLIYASISIGHTFKKHRILGSVLSYIGLTIIAQAVVGLLVSMISTVVPNGFDGPFTSIQGFNFGNTLLTVLLLFEICLAAIWYFISHYILTNQLNLE